MKKSVLLFLCLALLLALFSACSDGECRHLHMKTEETRPTCDKEGYILHTCPDCGYTYKSDYLAPLGHSIVYSVTQPTCDKEGYTDFSCTVCDYAYRAEYVAPPGHTYTETVIAATCSDAGYTEHRCNVCGYSYSSDFIDAPGHILEKKVTLPTCSEAGYTEYTCDICELSYRTEYVSANGHRFETEPTAPSLSEPGLLRHRCSVCGENYDSDPVYYGELLLSSGNGAKELLATGLDLSYHNGTVDFAAIKSAGFDFVILRAGFWGSSKDPKFDTYYADATAAGLGIGCYLYTESTTVSGIRSDAHKLLDYLDGKQFSYPIYLDMETETQKGLSSARLIQMARVFAEVLLDAGYFPGLYTNPDWLKVAYGDEGNPAFLMDIWLAHHNSSYYNDNPNHYAGKYGLWQYSGTESTDNFETVPGVTGRVDMNVCYKNYPAIIKTYGYNGY